jgi:RHS repeat-associated protein
MVTAKYDVTSPASEVATPNSQTYVTMTAYTLDGLGNRSQVGVTPYGGSTSTTTYASDVVNQYTSIASVSRTHDLNGNLTDDGNQEYVYDYANHLIEVKDSSSATVATYMYDALGRRVEKDVAGGAVTRYILWGVSIIEEVNGSGTWQASYVQTDRIDFPCAMDRADIADVDGDANTSEILRFHFHQQALGSVTEVSEPGGAIVEWVIYDVYGAATLRDQGGSVVGSSAVGNPFLFTGREYDAESGLYHYRARAYDPEAGRFLQRDPLGYVDGLSDRQYGGSRPSTARDPSGLKSECWTNSFYRLALAIKAHMQTAAALDKAEADYAEAQYRYFTALVHLQDVRRREPRCQTPNSAWRRWRRALADAEEMLAHAAAGVVDRMENLADRRQDHADTAASLDSAHATFERVDESERSDDGNGARPGRPRWPSVPPAEMAVGGRAATLAAIAAMQRILAMGGATGVTVAEVGKRGLIQGISHVGSRASAVALDAFNRIASTVGGEIIQHSQSPIVRGVMTSEGQVVVRQAKDGASWTLQLMVPQARKVVWRIMNSAE